MKGFRKNLVAVWVALVATAGFSVVLDSEAREKTLRKSEVQKLIPEGEYDLNGRRTSSAKAKKKSPVRTPASTRARPAVKSSKKPVAKKASKPTINRRTAGKSQVAQKRSSSVAPKKSGA